MSQFSSSPTMATAITTEFKAMIPTPPLSGTTPINLQSRGKIFEAPKYTFADLKAIILDPSGEWKPIKYFDAEIKKTTLLGMDMPIKYVIVTDKGSKELKNFPVEIAPACYMNNPIGRMQSKEEEPKTDEKKTYRPPNASYSLNEERHKPVLEDVTRFEAMINKFLDDNKDAIRKQRDVLRQQVNLQNKSTMTKIDPNDKKDIRLIGIVKVSQMVSNKTNQPVTYLNLDAEVADDDYRDFWMKQNNVKDDSSNNRNFRSKIDFHLFEPGAYENGALRLDMTPDGRIQNGRKMSLQEVVAEKVAKVLAIPTISFGALRFNITEKNFGVRIRKFLRYCAFIKQRPRDEIVRGYNVGGTSFHSGQFGQQPPPPPLDEPAPKRQKTATGETTLSSSAPSIIQVMNPPTANDEPPQSGQNMDEDGENMM